MTFGKCSECPNFLLLNIIWILFIWFIWYFLNSIPQGKEVWFESVAFFTSTRFDNRFGLLDQLGEAGVETTGTVGRSCGFGYDWSSMDDKSNWKMDQPSRCCVQQWKLARDQVFKVLALPVGRTLQVW